MTTNKRSRTLVLDKGEVHLVYAYDNPGNILAAYSDLEELEEIVGAMHMNGPPNKRYRISSVEVDEFSGMRPTTYFRCKVRNGVITDISCHTCPPWDHPGEGSIRYDSDPDTVVVTTYDLEKAVKMAEEALDNILTLHHLF